MNFSSDTADNTSAKEKITKKLIAALIVLLLTVSVVSTTVTAAVPVLLSDDTDHKRKKRQLELEDRALMENVCSRYLGKPQLPLPYRDRVGNLCADPNRNYCKKLTHMYSWEFLELAELLKEEILKPRETKHKARPKGKKGFGRPPKYDHINRLLFVLEWLSDGSKCDKQEFDNCYSRSSCDEDLYHILKAINKVLKDEVKWPNAEERQFNYVRYQGMFVQCVGCLDIWEHYISKSKDSNIENSTFSGKAGRNTRKTMAVINKDGYFIYVKTGLPGRPNDRDTFVRSDLYMNAGDFFSFGEKIISDGGFAGDGPILVSYNNVNTPEKALYNVAFKEVRVGIENAFGRVQMWFPILGIEKCYWNYDDELLELAVGAATKLHNWMLKVRKLSYNALDDPRNFHRNLY